MTKIKSNLTIRILSVGLVVLLSGSHNQHDDSFLDHLKSRLEEYNKNFLVERSYLLTDRFVYKPGEDLWFKGFVLTSGELPTVPNSEDFFIKLLNSKGEEIISRRYPLSGNQTSGRLLIPRTSIPGRYWLVAYTGWMRNQCAQQAFRKEILISKYFDKRFEVQAVFDKAVYYPGDTMNANIRIVDQTGRPISGTEFEYSLGSFAKRETKGSGKTDEMGLSVVSCVIPGSEGITMLTVIIRSRKISGDYSLLVPAVTAEPEITFYPEGGKAVTGLANTLAVKATDKYGLPVKITGEIIDHFGHILHTVSTDGQGLCSFDYLPGADTCYLVLTKPGGIKGKFPLPEARDQGLIIHYVKHEKDSLVFTVKSSDSTGITGTYWIATIGRRITWSRHVTFTGSTQVSIPVTSNTESILQVSVFDRHHELAAERLIATDKPLQQLIIKTDHKIYHSRQRVNVSVEFTGSSGQINLAAAVSLNRLSANRRSHNLVDICGFSPCDTAREFSFGVNRLSDLDLITTVYRNVYWDKVLDEGAIGQPFVRQDGISGKIFDKKENLMQHAKVRVTHIPNYKSYETQTDESGTFHVGFGTDIIDFNYLNVDAYDALGKVNLIASINQDYADAIRNNTVTEEGRSGSQKIQDVITYGEPDLVYALRYGPGKFRKSPRETNKKYDPNQYAEYTNVLDIIQDIKSYDIVNNTIVFTGTDDNIPVPMVQEGAIIVINGVLKGNKIDILRNLLPSDITNINISTSLVDVHKYSPISFQGVIEITTIQGMSKYRQQTIQLGMDILNTNRVFYSPDYAVESTTSTDNRKTLYWNPGFSVGPGQSTVLSFYTSDVKGSYYGRIEGIDASGCPVEGEFMIDVQ